MGRSALVLENGKIVTEYYRDDVEENETYQAWSVTKSFTSMLVGLMIDEELLALDTTLGEIFPQPDAWSDITDNSTDFRKDVTIEGIITHTSGLKTPYESSVAYMENILPYLSTDQIIQSYDSTLYTGGVVGGGESLSAALAALAVGTEGNFSIVGTSNILSYVVKNLTGMTPREDLQLVPESWVSVATTRYSDNTPGTVFFHETDFGYGYLFWVLSPDAFCAFGMLGQDVCVDKATNRVIVQQRDLDADNDDVYLTMNLGVNYVAGAVASEPNLSFQATTETTTVEEGTSDPDETASAGRGLLALPLFMVSMSAGFLSS